MGGANPYGPGGTIHVRNRAWHAGFEQPCRLQYKSYSLICNSNQRLLANLWCFGLSQNTRLHRLRVTLKFGLEALGQSRQRAALGCSGLYLVILGRTGLYLVVLSCTELWWAVLGCGRLYWAVVGYT